MSGRAEVGFMALLLCAERRSDDGREADAARASEQETVLVCWNARSIYGVVSYAGCTAIGVLVALAWSWFFNE